MVLSELQRFVCPLLHPSSTTAGKQPLHYNCAPQIQSASSAFAQPSLCHSTNEAASRVDCLTSLSLRTDLLSSIFNLRYQCLTAWNGWRFTNRSKCYTQLVAWCRRHQGNHPNSSHLPWSSISPLMPGLQYCCCYILDSYLCVAFDKTLPTDQLGLKGTNTQTENW